jgi:hypothetical protein
VVFLSRPPGWRIVVISETVPAVKPHGVMRRADKRTLRTCIHGDI